MFLYAAEGSFDMIDSGGAVLITVGTGELLLLPQGCRIGSVYTGIRNVSVCLSATFIDDIGPFVLSRNPVKLREPRPGLFSKLFEPLADADYLPSRNGIRESAVLFRLLDELGDISREGEVYDDISSDSCAAEIRRSFTKNLPVSRLAASLNMSEGHFRRLCRKSTGLSPVGYRNRLRAEKARELILSGGYTSAEAAAAVGFANVSYFCRVYRSFFGETAGDTAGK